MNKRLAGIKIAVLVSNGFCENDLTETQRALLAEGADFKIISLDHGLVNSWHGHGWGHHFAVDNPLSSALAADYAMLVMPGGRRSIDKLKLTAHTRRFIGGFMAARKPVAVCGSAMQLMIHADQVKGFTVTGPEDIRSDAVRGGAEWTEEPVSVHKNLITGQTDDHRETFIDAMIGHFVESAQALSRAAA
jgi:protease I